MILVPLSPRNSTSADVDTDLRQGFLLIVGPILIGALFNWFLLGALTMQVYVYYLCFPKDYRWIKFSAYGLYLLEIGQTVCVTEIAWVDLCAGWGIPNALLRMNWGYSMNPLVSGLIACWVQVFFAWRVWALGQNMFWKSIVVVILVVSFAQGCAAIVAGVDLSLVGRLKGSVVGPTKDLYFLYVSTSAFAAFLIAGSMLYFLISTGRRSTYSKETDRGITKLIRSTLETGALCSAMTFLDIAVYLHAGHVHIAIVMVLSKLYSNALMASLNSRAGIHDRPTISASPEESRTTHLNAAQFTSIGIPVSTGDFEWMNGGDGQGAESECVKTGLAHTSMA